MRLTYYRFPDGTPDEVLLENGCEVFNQNGKDEVNDTIFCSISFAKKMIKKYGGHGWTEHIDRSGGCFEVTEISLTGNNSKFKYNHHL